MHNLNIGSPAARWRLCQALAALALLGATAASAQSVASPDNNPLYNASREAGAVVTPTGLVFRVLKPGTGASPQASDTVRVHYRGSFLDGREFDSSYARGQPASFPLNRVIPCWTEGVQRMQVGMRAKLSCPAAMAYGSRGAGGTIPPDTPLQFEVELLEVQPATR